MQKEEFIQRYGEAAWAKKLQQTRDGYVQHREEANARSKKWQGEHSEECNAYAKKWRDANPDKAKAMQHEVNRKGGKYYEKKLIYMATGIQGGRHIIRNKHAYYYRAIKQATPNSVLHHEWIPGTAKYRGVALVEKEAHENGIIKVIKVLEGQITIFTEKEIKEEK